MAKLIFSMITSLDGYVEDDRGDITWGRPDEEVGLFVNDLEQGVGTSLYGRRMYETMVYWETPPLSNDDPAWVRDFADQWRASEKIVYSTSLDAVTSANTRLERSFDPRAIAQLKASRDRDIEVSGPHLAAQAFTAGLVDECRLYVTPVTLGRGKAALPVDLRLNLELLDERRFASGVVYLRYRVSL